MATEDDDGDDLLDEALATVPTEAGAVADVVSQLSPVEIISFAETKDGAGFALAVPRGKKLVSGKEFIDEFRKAPEFRKGTAQLGNLDSFIAHALRFKDEDSAIFASPDPQRPRLVSVLDYHRQGGAGAPRHGRHRGVYDFPLSEEWVRWTSQATKAMTQKAFAEFVESNILNIADPESDLGGGASEFARALGVKFASQQRVMELSRGLAVRVQARVQNAINLGTGETQFLYSTEHQNEKGEPLEVPGAFLLALRVFRGGPPYQVPVRLRHRVDKEAGSVSWSFELWRTDLSFEHAFAEATEKAAQATGLPIFVGSPEA